MTSLIDIREYKSTDKTAVLNLLRSNTPSFFAVEEELDLIAYLDNEIELYYVLLYDNLLVGCGGINFEDKHRVGKISWDILHPEYQGKALGTRLLKYRIQVLQNRYKVHKIKVRTSQLAYKFYQKQGFRLLEIKKDYWAEGFDMYAMEYNLV